MKTAFIITLNVIVLLCTCLFVYMNKLSKDDEVNKLNPKEVQPVAKISGKIGEFYIQKFKDGSVTCYVHKGSISCVR